MTRRRRALAALFALVAALLGGLVVAPAAAALPSIPGLSDCKSAPTPEVPGRGVVGFFESPPKTPPPAGDPFAPNSTTTIYQQYGYAGLRFNTYDLGCGPDVLVAPAATTGTSVANWLITMPKAAVAATGAVLGAAFAPTFLQVFDPLVNQVVQTLRRTVFDQWAALVVAALGLLLVWRARQASLASSAAAVGWALLVMVLATMVFRWPLVAGHAADQTVTSTLGAVTGGLNGTQPGAGGSPSDRSIAGMQEALLYQAWLGGTFGDANSDVAKRYGPVIFDSQAMTWAQAQVLKADPARGQQIIAAKQKTFQDTAAKIKAQDPDAYDYLTGNRSDSRVGYALLAGLAAMCAVPFLLIAGLLVLGALIIVRFGVMLFPAFATLGLFPTMRGLVTGIGNTLAAALINAIVFGIGAAVAVRGIGILLAPSTGLPPWLDVVLLLLFTIVMWAALRPFRRLTQMVDRNRNHFGAAAGGVGTMTRGVARSTGRILTTALGTFLGVSAADRNEVEEPGTATTGVPVRAEAISGYTEVVASSAGPAKPAAMPGLAAAGPVPGAAPGPVPGPVAEPASGNRAERQPAVTGEVSVAGRSEGGTTGYAWVGHGGEQDGARPPDLARRDLAGRFEAPTSSRPRGVSDVDLSDLDSDDLSEIFRPGPAAREAERVLEARRGG